MVKGLSTITIDNPDGTIISMSQVITLRGQVNAGNEQKFDFLSVVRAVRL